MSAVPAPSSPAWIPPAVNVGRTDDGAAVVEVVGAWNLRSLQPVLEQIRARLAEQRADARWDCRAITRLDHAGAMILWRAWGKRRAEHLQLNPAHEVIFTHLHAAETVPKHVPEKDWAAPITRIGEGLLAFFAHLLDGLRLTGRVTMDLLEVIRHPSRAPWKEISASVYRTGAQALGITALVGFLIGVVLSYLAGQQLKTFGANIFIINLLGVSIIRELGPVLAAILVAGRSGSAMTAQLGVMRVTEEIDAMAVMGIPHTLRLVLPKVIALAISMPLIVLWTDAIAMIGGMVIAQFELGLGMRYFLSALPDAVPIANLWLGLGKGVVFGILIALLACHYGLRIEPNTESLGAGTTSSVVASITMVIIVDAIFAIMFSHLGVV